MLKTSSHSDSLRYTLATLVLKFDPAGFQIREVDFDTPLVTEDGKVWHDIRCSCTDAGEKTVICLDPDLVSASKCTPNTVIDI